METKFLVSVGEGTPTIVCERHAQAFESLMIEQSVPHTILELEQEDTPKYCHACDLVVAKDYVKRREERENQPRIILPGEFH